MPDPTPIPTPTPTPTPAKKKAVKSDINQSWLTEIANARQVANTSLINEIATRMDDFDIDTSFAPTSLTLATKLEADIAKLKTARVAKSADTEDETSARDALIALIAPIQTGAKRVFKGVERQAYYIGADLGSQNLEQVLIAANNILARLVGNPPLDVLPGVHTDREIPALTAAIAAYSQKNIDQAADQSKAGALGDQIQADVDKLAGFRREIQLCADQAWPWRATGVAQIRKDFLLPANQPLND
jgi:hypothetical protein